jgi:hypothetical protein
MMAELWTARAQPIPQPLSHLVQLNQAYSVLVCVSNSCQCAVSPAALLKHLRRKHQTRRKLRQQVKRYVRGFPFQYNHVTVRLSRDRLALQLIFAVVDSL